MRKRRRYGTKDINRITITVSINDIDHPALYEAVVNNNMPAEVRRIFTSASGFLATQGNAIVEGVSNSSDILSEISNKIDDIISRLNGVNLVNADNSDIDNIHIDFS